MSAARQLRFFYLAHLSQPGHERPIYRAIRKQGVRSILELGVGKGCRALRMIEVVRMSEPAVPVKYTGIDQFELRSPAMGPGLSLKEAYRQLRATSALVQVVPGDPLAGLSRVANSLGGTDLVVIAADQDAESLTKAWYLVPRVLHDKSLVFLESASERTKSFRLLDRAEIDSLARRPHARAA